MLFIIVSFSSCEELLKDLHHDSDDPQDSEESCTDAFALKIDYPDYYSCFLDDGFDQWGWTSQMTFKHMFNYNTKFGTLYRFPLYVNEENCDTSTGDEIGYVELEGRWERDEADVLHLFANIRYVITTANYTLSEVNLYIGESESKYPKNSDDNDSISVTDYTYQVNLDSETEYTISNIIWPAATTTGYVNIIAHAKVCEANSDY